MSNSEINNNNFVLFYTTYNRSKLDMDIITSYLSIPTVHSIGTYM